MAIRSPKVSGKARIPLSSLMASLGLPDAKDEYPCVPGRKFRLDVAWPLYMVGVEQQGGIWMTRSGHNRMGRLRDNEKLNLCQIRGWIVLQFTPQELWRGYATDVIKAALKTRGWKGD